MRELQLFFCGTIVAKIRYIFAVLFYILILNVTLRTIKVESNKNQMTDDEWKRTRKRKNSLRRVNEATWYRQPVDTKWLSA